MFEGFSRVIFLEFPWVLASESASANSNMLKVSDKKDSKIVSVNVNWMYS